MQKRKYIVSLQSLNAKIAQLVEHNLAKVRVAGSSPVFRSDIIKKPKKGFLTRLSAGIQKESEMFIFGLFFRCMSIIILF